VFEISGDRVLCLPNGRLFSFVDTFVIDLPSAPLQNVPFQTFAFHEGQNIRPVIHRFRVLENVYVVIQYEMIFEMSKMKEITVCSVDFNVNEYSTLRAIY